MTGYIVKHGFTSTTGRLYAKGAFLDTGTSSLSEDEVTGLVDAGFIEEIENAAVEGDDTITPDGAVITPKPTGEGGGAPA